MSSRAAMFVICAFILSTSLISSLEGFPSRDVPTVPTNLMAEPMDESVRITWDYPVGMTGTDLLGFVLYKGTNPESVDLILKNDLGPFDLVWIDTAVTNGNTYYYSVKAINDDGSGPKSAPVSAVPRGPASPPKNFSADHDSNVIFLHWEAPADENGSPLTGYSVFKGYNENNITIRTDVGMSTFFTDSGLINGVTYYYQVLAITAYGDGMKTAKLSRAPKTTPSAPENLTLTSRDAEVFLNWTASADDGGTMITGYKVFRGTATEDIGPIATVSEGTTYSDRTVTNGVRYIYSVAGINSEGVGTLAVLQSVTPLGPPSQPQNLSLRPGDSQVTLTWQVPEFDGGTEILGYNVYMNQHGEEMELVADAGDVLEYSVLGLENGKIHYFQVRGYNEVGEGKGSETLLIRPEPLPKTPENFRIIDMEGQVKLIWSKPTYTGEYPYDEVLIYRGPSENDTEYYTNVTADLSSYYDENVDIGTVYYYEISIISLIGEGYRTPAVVGRPFGRPSVPGRFSAVGEIGVVKLTWEQPERNGGRVIEGFNIFRGTEMGTLTVLDTVLGTETSFEDHAVTNGVSYYYKISAYNVELEGNATSVIQAMPVGPPKEPKSPQGIIDVRNGSIVISWTAPVSDGGDVITSYRIYRGLTKDNMTFLTEVSSGTEFIDSDIQDGAEYYYTITAINSKGEGISSSHIFVDYPDKAASSGDSGSNALLWISIGIVVVLLMVVLVIVAVASSKKKQKKETKEEEAPILEESEAEREERLILERRKMMDEFTGVPIDPTAAHAGDHVEHKFSYEDLYGPTSSTQDAIAGGGIQQPTPGGTQVPEGPISPQQAQPAYQSQAVPQTQYQQQAQNIPTSQYQPPVEQATVPYPQQDPGMQQIPVQQVPAPVQGNNRGQQYAQE